MVVGSSITWFYFKNKSRKYISIASHKKPKNNFDKEFYFLDNNFHYYKQHSRKENIDYINSCNKTLLKELSFVGDKVYLYRVNCNL